MEATHILIGPPMATSITRPNVHLFYVWVLACMCVSMCILYVYTLLLLLPPLGG